MKIAVALLLEVRCMRILVALLLLAFTVHAATVNDFIAPYLQQGEHAPTSEVVVGVQTYTLVNLSGTYAFVVRMGAAGYEFVQDKALVEQALRQRMLVDINVPGRVDAAWMKLLEFNASRQPAEATCKQYTGTDRIACFYNASEPDRSLKVLSCTRACRSVPICQTAVSYNLDGIYEIFYFANDTKHMDFLIQMEDDALARLRASVSSDDAAEARSIMAGIRSTMNRILANGLADPVKYNFCPKIVFKTGALDEAESKLAGLRTDILLYENAGETAAQVLNTTARRLQDSRQKDEYLRLAGQISNRINATKVIVAKAQAVVNEKSLEVPLTQAEGMLAALLRAIEEKSFATAGSLLAQADSQVVAANASAVQLIGKYTSALNSTYNCTAVALNASILDGTPLARGRAEEFAGRLAAARAALNKTPMEPAAFYAAEADVRAACLDARVMMSSAAVPHYAQKEGAIAQKVATAKQIALQNGTEIDDKEVRQLVYGAYAVLNQTGDMEGADALFLLADSKAGDLIEFAKTSMSAGATAQEKIENARRKLDDARSSPLLLIVKPDLKGPEATIVSAQKLLESNPDAAGQLADKASADIGTAVNAATTTNIAILAIGGGLVLVLIVGAVLFVFVLRKKKK